MWRTRKGRERSFAGVLGAVAEVSMLDVSLDVEGAGPLPWSSFVADVLSAFLIAPSCCLD